MNLSFLGGSGTISMENLEACLKYAEVKKLSEEYDLKKSEKIGQLYPVIKDKFGNVIDGKHRLQADPDWRTETIEGIDSDEKLLVARAVANWHRRAVPESEKREWINGLAEIYLKQGLKIKAEFPFENEIKNKIAEVTGLHPDTVNDYLHSKFKQGAIGGWQDETPRPVSASQRVETRLGSEVAERFRKEVLEEATLSPEEKAEREAEKQRKAEESKIKKEKQKRKREENKLKKEEKLQKQAEERAKNLKKEELLKDKDFLVEASKKLEEEEKRSVEELTPSLLIKEEQEKLEHQDLRQFLMNYSEALKKIPNIDTSARDIQIIISIFKKSIVERNIKCPICGNSALKWGCGHEF